MSKQIIIVKPQSLSSKDKEKLTKNGYVVIEHPFPQDVRIIQPIEEQQANDLLMSSLHAIVKHDYSQPGLYFVQELNRRLKQNEQSKTNQP